MRPLVCANHQLLIWVRMAPLPGMPSGRMTSKAESRSVATSSRASPRSKISRTLPEAIRGKGRPSMLVTAVVGRADSISAKFIGAACTQRRNERRGQSKLQGELEFAQAAGAGAGPEARARGFEKGARAEKPVDARLAGRRRRRVVFAPHH